MVLQLLASLALLRALHVILGWRPVLLMPLTFALFTPLGVPGFAWWAAALNSLPMLAALAWVCADAILLVRTGNQRYAITGALVYLGGLLFFEKAAVIPFVAFAVAALLCHVHGDGAPLRTVWRGGHAVVDRVAGADRWRGSALYLAVVDQRRWSPDLAMTEGAAAPLGHARDRARAGRRAVDLGPLGAGVAVGTPPGGGDGAGLAGAGRRPGGVAGPQAAHRAGVADRRRLRRGLPGADLSDALVAVHRAGTGADAALSCRIWSWCWRCWPRSASARRTGRPRSALAGRLARPAPRRSRSLAVLFIASSLYSTATFLTSLARQSGPALSAERPTGAGRRARGVRAPLLDQEVDPLVLQRVAWPENLASHMFALLRDRPEFSTRTTDLRVLDDSGRLVDARVTWVRTIMPGPMPQCGYFVQPDQPVRLALDGPLLPAEWTAEINYLANSDGSMTLSLSEGPRRSKLPVHPGLNAGLRPASRARATPITVRANTAALAVCIAAGPVGLCWSPAGRPRVAAQNAASARGPRRELSRLGESNP